MMVLLDTTSVFTFFYVEDATRLRLRQTYSPQDFSPCESTRQKNPTLLPYALPNRYHSNTLITVSQTFIGSFKR